MAKRVAVILSGCGSADGAEITESVSTLVALDEVRAEVQVFAPAGALEAANRIARGSALDLCKLRAADFDAVILPGGYGVVQVLWGDPDIARVLREFYALEKPIGAVCIAPALVVHTLGSHGITVTCGAAGETSAQITAAGAIHEECAVDDFVTDREHRIVTTPAYMYDDARPAQVFRGIQLAVRELVEMA